MSGDDDWKRLIEGRLNDQQKDVDSLKLWRAFILGGAAVIAYMLGFASHELANVLHKLGGL